MCNLTLIRPIHFYDESDRMGSFLTPFCFAYRHISHASFCYYYVFTVSPIYEKYFDKFWCQLLLLIIIIYAENKEKPPFALKIYHTPHTLTIINF